ncbi:unnamed protein product, partial [Brenthis ino]
MHAYHTRCDGQTMSQRTCESPFVYVIGYTCGWSRCDCNGDLLYDEQSGYCVKETDCPLFPTRKPKPRRPSGRRKGGKQKYHSSKRIRIKEEELPESQ